MKSIFDPIKIGNIEMKNRLVRSATMEMGGAKDGIIQPLLKNVLVDLAKGGVGLIITGMMGVAPRSCGFSGMTRMYDDSFLPKMKEIISEVHKEGGKIVIQLSHCGLKARVIDEGECPLGPSDMDLAGGRHVKAMTQDDIDAVVGYFAKAAAVCKEAGADGVQIHGGHGYFISQFLSPYYNKRTDRYGGAIENRARLLLDACRTIREKTGPDFPLLVKINSTDLVPESISFDECLWACKELEKIGVTAIEISGGIAADRQSSPLQPANNEAREGYFSKAANQIAAMLSIPVISVGGYRSYTVVERVLNEGNVAAISLSRPLILEPDLPNRWASGDHAKSSCISCMKCFTSREHGCRKPGMPQGTDAPTGEAHP